MPNISVPAKDLATIAYRSAKSKDMVTIQIGDAELVHQINSLPTNEIQDAIETGEFVGQGTAELEGTIEINGEPVKVELTFYFENSGTGSALFYKA